MIKIDATRPALEVTRDGESQRWEYDLVTVKLECERLEEAHGLRKDAHTKPPTTPMLIDLAAFLEGQGLTGCTPTVALQLYQLVKVQFSQLSRSLAQQVSQSMQQS